MSGDLKHRMYDYEVKPPQAVWDSIAEGLDEQPSAQDYRHGLETRASHQQPLAKKMRAYEVTPPAAVWRNIVAALKKGSPAKVITFQKIYRWSAAAAVILLAGVYYFLNYSDTAKSVAHTNAIIKHNATEQITNDDDDNDVAYNKSTISPVRRIASNHNRQKVYTGGEENAKILPLSYVEDADPITDDQAVSVTPKPILTASDELIQDKSVINPHNDKYISITAPNGQQTKISSRLMNAMHYFSGINPDPKAKDSTLQKRIHEWRNRILQSDFVPSSSNFLDILEITDMVEEKKQS